MTRPPNIIFLMSDQQRWDALGCTNPRVQTPHLDRLASVGRLYRQATCQGPVCIPSRHSMMLGLYPSQIGVRANHIGITQEQRMPLPTLAERLHKAGYQTAGFGKTHWNHRAGGRPPSRRGFEVRAIAQSADGPLYEEGATMMDQDAPASFGAYHSETSGFGPGEQGIEGYRGCTSQLEEEAHRDGWVTRQCLNFLKQGRDESRPLFLYLSFLRPHAGFNAPQQFEALYDPESIPVPEQPPWAIEPPGHVSPDNEAGLLRYLREQVTPAWNAMTPHDRRISILRYWACCSWLDDMLGRVLQTLEARGELEHSLIVFLSDHGDMMGDRGGRLAKMCLYEGSVRVPLIIAGSCVPEALRGQIDDRPVELVDVLPTILETAGLGADPRLPGRSLLSPTPRFGSFAEAHGNGDEMAQRAPAYMWRRPDWKLIVSIPGTLHDAAGRLDQIRGELYNLAKDPNEWENLFELESHRDIRQQMLCELMMHLSTAWARFPWQREMQALEPPPGGREPDYVVPDTLGNTPAR